MPTPHHPEPRGDRAGEEKHGPSAFLTTHWSVVRAAGQEESAVAREALATLCQTYWRPLYTYVRRRGYSAHDAEDLTQGLFARLLERDDLATVRREKGKFRSYLLGAMNHFLSDEWDKARAPVAATSNTPPSTTRCWLEAFFLCLQFVPRRFVAGKSDNGRIRPPIIGGGCKQLTLSYPDILSGMFQRRHP